MNTRSRSLREIGLPIWSFCGYKGMGLSPMQDLGDSNAVRTGDVVLSIGSPFGFEQSVTSGIISSRNRTLNIGGMVYENLIQTDSSINKGSSGGPLINAKGEVIAINTAIYSPSGAFLRHQFCGSHQQVIGTCRRRCRFPKPSAPGRQWSACRLG